MYVEWDEAKNRANQSKHGISFETAALVFDDPYAISRLERVVDGEERWQTMGLIGGTVVVLVAHTEQERHGEIGIRVISAPKPRGTKGRPMRKANRGRLTAKQKKELAALARLSEDKIDVSDIPEIRDWRGAVVGKFYRPIKQAVTLRVDADVLTWLKDSGSGYQTRINALLRKAMDSALERPRVKRGRMSR